MRGDPDGAFSTGGGHGLLSTGIEPNETLPVVRGERGYPKEVEEGEGKGAVGGA